MAALIAPRRLLFCQARDQDASGAEALSSRFQRITGSAGRDWIEYHPAQPFGANLLRGWLRHSGGRASQADPLDLMCKVNSWQLAHPVIPAADPKWERATWYTGVMADWKSTKRLGIRRPGPHPGISALHR